MKEKSVTFCFLKLNAKKKANFPKIIVGRVTFLWKIQVSSEAVAMELWKRKTRDYHQKLNVRVASRIVEQFRTFDLKK